MESKQQNINMVVRPELNPTTAQFPLKVSRNEKTLGQISWLRPYGVTCFLRFV